MEVQQNANAVTAQEQWRGPETPGSFFEQTRQRMRNVKLGRWAAGGVLLLVLLGFWYWSHGGNSQVRDRGNFSAVPVHVGKVQRRDMEVVERTIGTVVAYSTVDVTPRIQGEVQSVFFKEGQLVKKGDLLFLIDPRPFQAAVDQMKGQLVKDQAVLDGARRDLQRFRALLLQNAESQQVVDDQVATVDADEGVVEADQANLKTAELNLEFTQIRSPVDGKTGPINIMPGNEISVTGTTATVNPLVVITQIQPIKISFFLPQTDLPRIEARQNTDGLNALVDMSDVGGESFNVPVDFVGNLVNTTTGTIELRANYDNKNESLVPGQLINVVVELANIPNAIVVPHDAIAVGPNGQYVYKVVGGRAQQVPVEVLFDDSKSVAVKGELSPGDDVVVEGQLELVPGSATEIVEGAQAKPGGSRGQNGGKGRRGGGNNDNSRDNRT